MTSPRLFIRTLVRRLGYDLHSLPVERLTLRDLEFDLPCLVGARDPRVLDVGANVGQSIDLFRRTLNNPRIVSFEPNPTLATGLRQKYAACGVRVEAMALGSSEGTISFNVLENHELSSVLPLLANEENPFRDTAVLQIIEIPITTVDSYLRNAGLDHVHLLKIDTQGYDLEVLRGAIEALGRRAIGIIFVEVNLISLYAGQGSFGEVERFLAGSGYGLLGLYEVNRLNGSIRWATACFQPAIRR